MLHDVRAALVCIAKNEPQIAEWVAYHKALGFDEIIVYENDWSCPEELEVTKYQICGKVQQCRAYNHFMRYHSDPFNWVAFWDCDEYLVLKQHQDVHAFLAEHQLKRGLAVNTVIFGCKALIPPEDNSLLKRFTKRDPSPDRHVKMILNTQMDHFITNPHHPTKHLFDTDGNKFKGPFNPGGPIDVVQLNHYYYKSFEEWIYKCQRGGGNGTVNKPITWIAASKKETFFSCRDTLARDFALKHGIIK